MRQLPTRPKLSSATRRNLEKRTNQIRLDREPTDAAARIHESARKAKWFAPIIQALMEMAGLGSRCMFCNGSEAAQIEHFRPKAVFPFETFLWENLLWVCSICNQSKGDRFPPDTEPGERIIDPTSENVWDFFFIDEYGNLTSRWRTDLDGLDPRAEMTRIILALDRDALQQSRQSRLRDLKGKVQDVLTMLANGSLTLEDVSQRLEEWVKQPFQPDVADYFLRGPGRNEAPFSDLLGVPGPAFGTGAGPWLPACNRA